MSETSGRKLEGRHVLYMLLGFFGVMFAVNGVFVYVALTSFSGVTEKDAYVKGLNYNVQIDAAKAMRARGWQVDLATKSLGDSKSDFVLSILGSDGKPLSVDRVEVQIRRPAVEDQDFKLDLTPQGNTYVSVVEFPLSGQWDVTVLAHGGGYNLPYRLEKRIWVK